MLRYDVLTVGSAVMDNFMQIEDKLSSIQLGDKVLVKSQESHSGGGATNSAAALSKFGLKVKMLAKLGKDHQAEFILNEMKQYKVKNICLSRSNKPTNTSTLVSSNKDSDRIIFAYKGASQDLSINDIKRTKLNTKWIYLASLMGKSFNTAKWLVEHAKRKNINVLFNPSLYLAKKGKIFLKPILKNTNILVLNKHEAQSLLKTNSSSFSFLLKSLNKLGPKTVVITYGNKPYYALNENKIHKIYPPKIKPIHTAGAGDAFTSALLAGIIKKYLFEDSLKLGQANASSLIQSLGTKKGLLNESQAKKFIKKNKIKITS